MAAVAALDDKVNLRTRFTRASRMTPGRQLRLDAGDSQRLLDLIGMQEADLFECKALPYDPLLVMHEMKPMAVVMPAVVSNVNGDHAVQNAAVKSVDGAPQLKVRQIENEFLEKMFAAD